ncbi:hypothetical protein Taro_039035 [Colocasia esculenta]|uniref:beta-glucosidase n=1 Tax=Colocasia esculenta TaxID=4460 RepID=A0A843WNZ2_COLES|nr:hypothetical protein [Colocasia esculenta]
MYSGLPRFKVGRYYESYSVDPKIVQMMTGIIPRLQRDIPANFRKVVAFVDGNSVTKLGRLVSSFEKYVITTRVLQLLHMLSTMWGMVHGTHDGINENNTIINKCGLTNIHMPDCQVTSMPLSRAFPLS